MDWTALCSSSPCQSMMAQKASSDSLWPGHLASFCRGCPAGIPSSLVPLDLLVSAGVVLELELDDEEGEGVFPFAVFGRCFVGFALDFGVVCKQLSLPSFLPSAGDESANRPGQGPPSLPCWWKRACGVCVRGCSPRSLQHVECVRRCTPKIPRTLARIRAWSPRPLRPILSTSPNTFPHVVPTAGGGPPTV